MFRKILVIVALVFITILICGCFSTPAGKINFDPNLPSEETAYIVISQAIFVKEYNGINVQDTWYKNDKLRVNRVTLPAGEANLLFNIRAAFGRGNITYTLRIEDIQFKHNFEAGKEYTIGVYAGPNTGGFFSPKQKVYLAIWDRSISGGNPGNNYGSSIIRSWEISEF